MDLPEVPDGAESNLLKSMRSVKAAVAFDLKLNQLTNNLEFKGHLVDPNTYKLYVAKITDADVPESDCVQILGSIGRKQAYHPVKVWLETLHETYKDSTIEFLDLPSRRYLHTEKPIYDVFLQKQLIAAVARVYQPGCKVDTALIVQGPQGILKSTFLNKLCGDEWFDDNLGSDVENKDELLKLHRCWFQEWGEIDRITSKKELGLVKSFLSRKKDTFRAPYERTAVEHPRSCVIVGSVNPSEFLRDEEDRRLWIIPVSERIDIEALVNDRDKLWAAAVALYKAGHQWHLDADEETELRESNKQFALRDVWEEPIEVWLSLLANTRRRKPDEPIEWVRVQDILVDCLEIKEVKSHTNFDKKRVQEILRRLGWKASDSSVRLPGFTSPQRAWSKAVAPTPDHPPLPTPDVSEPIETDSVPTPTHLTRGSIPVTIEPETCLWGDRRDLMKVKNCQGEIVDRNVALTDLAPIATPQDLAHGSKNRSTTNLNTNLPMNRKMTQTEAIMTTWVAKADVMALLQISERTLARYRSDHWYIGIHYSKPVQKILYNRELLEDWMINRHEWGAHLRAIEFFQASLPSNQKRRKAG